MAFPLSRAVPESNYVPLPASPVVWAGYVRRTFWNCILLTFLWALSVTMLGFFFPIGISNVFDDVVHFVPALLLVVGLVGALSLGRGIGNDFKYVIGFGVIRRTSDRSGRTVMPVRGRRVVHAAMLSGLVIGCLVAACIRAASAHWLGFLLLAGFAVLLLWPAIKVARLAQIVWRQAKTEQRIHRNIVAGGDHAVGIVVAVTNELFTVDNGILFHVDVEFETAGRRESARIHFVDFPVWAPAMGSEFDVWTDPERPFVADRILLERRYVGQEFVGLGQVPVHNKHGALEDVTELSLAAADHGAAEERDWDQMEESGPGSGAGAGSFHADVEGEIAGSRSMPQWMADEAQEPVTPAAARRTRLLISIPPTLIAVLALAGALLTPIMIADIHWWTSAAVWLYAFLTTVNALIYWQFMVRSRWFVRSGVSFGGSEAAVFVGFFGAGFAMLTTHSMVMAPLHGEIPWTLAHVLTWAAVIGALLVFQWSFTSNAWALKHLNAEFPTPPEVIQEALTGHDPAGIDQLEIEYGYRAGVFLCT